MKSIRKAVFPVAGLGTRFLPATKASPKEMMTVVDKPLIQYAVEEAVDAGIKELIFVTSGEKRAIEDHFDKNYELEIKLEQKGKTVLLEMVQNILPKNINCVYVRQQETLGLGHAVLCAKHLINNEPFAVLLADDLIQNGSHGCLKKMVTEYNNTGASVLATEMVPIEHTDRYGIVSVDSKSRVHGMIEKPTSADAPSNQAVVGRYILPPEIFSALEQTQKGSGGEIQLTDAISSLLKDHHFVTCAFEGKRYDCGSKLGYLKANLELALSHPEVGERWHAYLKERLTSL